MQHYLRKQLTPDLLAGLTGAVAGAPQAMGFAIVAGISPLYGLYTAFVATIFGAIFSSSTYMTIGPTNALSLVVGSTLIGYEGTGEIERLFVLTLLVGVFQLAFGVLRLGWLTRFVSNAVMTGFITGAGLLIILGQLDHLTGVHGDADGNALQRFFNWVVNLPESDPQTVIIGVLSILMIWGLHHTRFKSVATLAAILVTSVFVAVAGLESVDLVVDIAPIPSGLPDLIVPEFSYVPELLTAAFAMAILGSVQSAGISENVPQPDGSRPSVTRDLIAQGVGNIAGGFFQSMPACGSLSRTAVNVSAGARTRMANIFAGLMVGLVLIAFGEYIEQITLATLAGHLVVAAASLIRLDSLRTIWRVNPSSRFSMLITLVATLILPLEYSIYIGVAVSSALYVYTSAGNIKVRRLLPTDDNRYRETDLPPTLPAAEPVILSVSGHLFFAAMRQLEAIIPHPADTQRPVVILRLRDNMYLGNTGARFLCDYADKLRANGGLLLLSGVSPHVNTQLERTGTTVYLGTDHIFHANEVIFSATDSALAYAESWLENAIKGF